jgi:cation transport regulator ChaC
VGAVGVYVMVALDAARAAVCVTVDPVESVMVKSTDPVGNPAEPGVTIALKFSGEPAGWLSGLKYRVVKDSAVVVATLVTVIVFTVD